MTGHVVWLAEDMSLAESGAVYGPGLLDCGLAPERLITVAVCHRRDLLWAMEEALRCRSIRAVVGEIRAGALDTVAVRRLSLAATESGALALLLRTAPSDDASTAATRWLVGAASSPSPGGEGSARQRVRPSRAGPMTGSARRGGVMAVQERSPPPGRLRFASAADLPPPGGGEEERLGILHLTAHLVRNRRGALGSWILTWSDGDGAHAQPLAAPAADRPHRAIA